MTAHPDSSVEPDHLRPAGKVADLLFSRQHKLELEVVVGYSAEVGLDVEEFLGDLDDEGTAARVRADEANAEASGARGTSTFFIGNARHTRPHDTETPARALEASRDSAGVPDGR